jgi:hypothetical protein
MIRRTGAVLAVPAVGYLILMASSLLGGPRLDTPLIPEAITKPAARPHPTPGKTPAPLAHEPTAGSSDPADPTPTNGATPTPTVVSVTPTTTPAVTPTGPTVVPTAGTTGVPASRPSGTPTSTPTSGNNGKKPTVPPGHTKTPPRP